MQKEQKEPKTIIAIIISNLCSHFLHIFMHCLFVSHFKSTCFVRLPSKFALILSPFVNFSIGIDLSHTNSLFGLQKLFFFLSFFFSWQVYLSVFKSFADLKFSSTVDCLCWRRHLFLSVVLDTGQV